ncbi:MAG: type II toxin-antitoxin system HicB family antitoxin [Chloroflexia bacterium]|nr:type II toxin-antitoxin system HicB family antitoxin [Chloroflexia bacterium]
MRPAEAERMTSYDLYLESGPKHRKTMVHVLDLLGCVAVGPTTEEALAATPEAIQAYLRFLHRIGEPVDPEAPVTTRIAEHITKGEWLGNGSPYLMFEPDWQPVSDEETKLLLHRFRSLCEELAAWAATQTDRQLDAVPDFRGRTARAILLHVLGAQGSYLAAALGGAPGFSRLHGAASRGEFDLATALRRSGEMATDRVQATTAEERSAVRHLPAGPRTFRKALRRMLEHDWEHLAELARRPDGPRL